MRRAPAEVWMAWWMALVAVLFAVGTAEAQPGLLYPGNVTATEPPGCVYWCPNCTPGPKYISTGADCGGSGSVDPSAIPTPGGSNGQVQYNDSGAFGGDAGMSYDETEDMLSVERVDADQLGSILGPVPVTLTGTTTISGRVVTGSGTAFLSEVRPGDVLYTSNISNTGIVLNVWTDTTLLIARAIGDGSGLTTKILRSPLAVGADYPSHCGIGEDAETDASSSTTLDICAGSEDCDSTTICVPSYTFHVGDVIALDSAPSTYARVTAVDDTAKQITVDTALGNGSESQAIRIRRLGFVVTALGDLIAGANDGSVLPIRPESSGYEGGYTDFMFFAGKPRLQTRSASFIETGDPPDLTLGRIGDGPYPIAVATSVPATQAGSRVGDFQWKGWRGDRLTAPLVIMRGRAVENFSNTAQGMKWEVLTTPAGTITPLRYLVLEDSGDMTLACSNTDGGTCPGTAPRFRLSEAQANGSNYVGLKSPASLSASWDLTLPADDGNASDCLKSDGSGVTSWGSCVGTATTPTPAAHQFYAGPTSGAAGAAVWRTIVQSDLPFPATITPVPTWTPGVTATPVPTITPFACGTAYAVQQVTNGTPVCVLLPTPDGNGAAPVPTLTPHNLLDGQMHRDTIAGTPCAGCDIAARGTAWGVRTPGPTWTPVLTATPVPSMTPVPTITPPWTLAQEYQLAAGEVLAGKSGGGTVATVVPTGMVVHAGNGVFKAYATITPVPTWTPGLTATPVPSFTPYVTPTPILTATPVPSITAPIGFGLLTQLGAGEVLVGNAGATSVPTVMPTGMVVHAGNGVYKAYATVTPILTATPVASMTPVPTITPPWTLAQLYQLAAGQVFVGKSGDTTVATAVPTGMLVHDGNGVFKAYATVTPVPTWTPGLTATPVPSMTPVPSPTAPYLISVEEGDVAVANCSTVDLNGTNFDVSQSPTGECNINVSSNVLTTVSGVDPSQLSRLGGDDAPRTLGNDDDVTHEWKSTLNQYRVTVGVQTPATVATPFVMVNYPSATGSTQEIWDFAVNLAKKLTIFGDGSITSTGTYTGDVDASADTLKIPTSTSANATASGSTSFDTNGGTAGVPLMAVGDGSKALPIRTCWQEFGVFDMGAGTTSYSFPGGFTRDFGVASAKSMPSVNKTISGLACTSYLDPVNGATAVLTMETATISACTAANDGNVNTCTWSASTLTCTITGTTGFNEASCTDTTHAVALATTQYYHLKAATTGTWAGNDRIFHCSWMACADAVW